MSRILCTGGAGFIGKHTVKLLKDAGHDVLVYDYNAPIQGNNSPHDILSEEYLPKAFRRFKPDAVLHLAANSSLQKGIEDPVYDARNNIIGTIKVLQAMKDHGCKRIVFASTSAVYHPYADIPFRENTPLNPITPYGISKLACEYYVRTLATVPLILRYGNVYGPDQSPLGENILIARTIDHMLNETPFKINGDGEQIRDFVFVDDVAKANLLALENPHNFIGELNVSTGRGASVLLIVELLRRIIGYGNEIEHGPAIYGEIREVVMSPDSIERLFPWRPEMKLEEGLKRTVEAWKSKSSIPVS